MARTMSIQVTGIHCEGCESTIETSLSKLAGVVKATASHVTGRVEVSVQGEGAERAVTERLRDLGFDPVD